MANQAFLSHFVIVLAAIAVAVLAALAGIPQEIFASDASYMTSAIAALAIATALRLGWEAWRADNAVEWALGRGEHYAPIREPSFGHVAEKLVVMVGMLGTVIGLSMQLRAVHGSVDSLAAFSTQFASTGCGIAAAVLISVMTHNIEARIAQARS